MEDIKAVFGRRLKSELDERKWSQAYFARRLNKSPSNVSMWVRGLTSPSLEELARVAAELGISPDRLIRLDGEPVKFIPKPKPEDIVEDVIRTYGFVPPKRLKRPYD